MIRRSAICAALAAASFTMILGHPRGAVAGTIPCREVYGSGGGYVCGADVESRLFDPAYQASQTQTGAWADTMAMIVAYSGGEITQADILSAVFGVNVPPALTPAQALTYSTRSFTGANKAVSDATGTSLAAAPIGGSKGVLRSLIGQLTDGDTPLMVITSHNAMLLTRIYYHADLFGKPSSLYMAVVRDPFPQTGPPVTSAGIKLEGYPGQRFMTPAEYADIQSVIQVSVKNH